MKIIGAVSWFNETPSWLVKTISSLGRVCDQVVVVDGRYALFQHDMDWSPAPETEAVVAAAEGVGIPLTLHIPRTPFYGNEVEKRNLVLKLAMVHAEPMEDWILVIDADEYIVHAAPDLHSIVAGVKEHAISFLLEEYLDPFVDLGTDGGVARHQPLPNTWRADVRGMYRTLPELQYVRTHYTLGGRVDDEWTWLWGHQEMCRAHDLREHLVIRHENPRRTAMRRRQAADYYAARDELEIEVRPVAAP